MSRTIRAAVVTAAVMALGAVGAWAANWGDSFSITFTPAGDRGVIITSDTVALSNLNLNSTTYIDNLLVTSTGSIEAIEYTLAGGIAGGWNLSEDGQANGDNEAVLYGLFSSTKPALVDFESAGTGTDHLIHTGSAHQVGDVAGLYEGNEQMDDLGLNAARHLWMELKTPPTASIDEAQTITVTITAEVNN